MRNVLTNPTLIALAVVALVTSTASADPVPLTTYTGTGFTVSVPKNWKVTVDVKQGMLVAVEDPARKDGAMLLLMMKPNGTKVTEDQLLDSVATQLHGLKITQRGPMPGGRGHALLAEGEVDHIQIRAGAAAVADASDALVGALVARASTFDSLGGLQLVVTSMSSLRVDGQPAATTPSAHGKTSIDSAIDEMKRSEKRTDGAELDPSRAHLDKSTIVGAWTRGSGGSFPIEDYRTATTTYGHYSSSGEGELFAFGKDGTYKITNVANVDGKYCKTKSVQFETGTYQFDGATLTMKVKDAYGIYSICGKQPERENKDLKKTKPRSYDVGLSDDGRLIMVGPACGAIDEYTCPAHARWEMKKK